MNKEVTVKERRKAPLQTPTGLGDNARRDITGALNALLADVFAVTSRPRISIGMSADRISATIISFSTSRGIKSSP